MKTFFHGHSYSGNQLGCAVARASLSLLHGEHSMEHVRGRTAVLEKLVQRFWQHPNVGDVRCEGMLCAIELVQDFTSRSRFPFEQRVGHRVCEAARAHGLLTRCVGDVLVLMPPYCVTDEQLAQATDALWLALGEILPV
jgi:adenosylmethionine-8-amino-7-oxononanoate aminotransferase